MPNESQTWMGPTIYAPITKSGSTSSTSYECESHDKRPKLSVDNDAICAPIDGIVLSTPLQPPQTYQTADDLLMRSNEDTSGLAPIIAANYTTSISFG